MTKRTRMIIALGAVASCGWSSCSLQEEPCTQPAVVTLRMRALHRADTGTAVRDSFLPRPLLIAPDAAGGPVVFLFGKKVSRLSLRLNPNADSARWIVRQDSANVATQDTLIFRYGRRVQFLSNTCGYTYFYTLQSVTNTTHTLDSVRIGVADVTNDANAEHIRLYY